MKGKRYRSGLLLCLFLIVIHQFELYAQGSRLSITYTNPSGLSVCGDTVGLDINVQNISLSTVSSLELTAQLPSGIEYVSGSVTGNGVSEKNISNLSRPIFELPDLRIARSVKLRIRVRAICDIIPDLNNNRLIRNTFRVDYSGNFDMVSGIPYNVSQPNLRIQSVSNKFYTGEKGSSFIRKITLINSGQGPLNRVSFYQTNGSGLQVTGVHGGSIRYSGDTIFSTFDSTDFKLTGNKDGKLNRNESVEITDTILLKGCAPMGSKYLVRWGCSGDYCSSDQDAATANLTNRAPELRFSVSNSNVTCMGGNQALKNELKVFNSGNDTARRTDIDIFQAINGNGFWDAQFSKIDTSSLFIRKGFNGQRVRPQIIDLKMNRNTGQWSCLGNDAVGAAKLLLNELAPGDTIYIEFDQYSCCRSGCNSNSYIYGWRYQAGFHDQCNKLIKSNEAWGRIHDYTYVTLTSFNPTDIIDKETKLFTYTVTNYRLALNNPRSLIKVRFVLPQGTNHSGNKNDLRFLNVNGTYWNPAQLIKSGDTMIAYFRGRAPFNLVRSELKIKLTGDCSNNSHGNQNYALIIDYISDSTCNNVCTYPLHCSSGSIRVHCISNCSRGGMFFKNFELGRINFGLADNDNNGLPDSTGQLDFDKIKDHRMMVGDTLRTRFSGIAYPAGSIRGWRFGKAISQVQFGNVLKVAAARIRVYRRGNLMLDCNRVPVSVNTIGSTRTFTFDISIGALASACAIGTYYQYGTYDSIDLQVDYVFESNPGGVFRASLITNEFYLSTVANPSSSSQKYQCDTISGIYQQVGYYLLNYARGNYVHRGCGDELVTQNYYLSIGNCCSNYSGGNIFPFEYRNWGNISAFKAIVPKGYSFGSARLFHYVTAGTGATRREDVTNIALSARIGDTLILNMDSLYSDLGGPLTLGDDGFLGIVYLYLKPSCEVEDNKALPVDYLIEFRERNAMGNGIIPITTNNGRYTDYITYEHPDLKLYPINEKVSGNTDTVRWRLLVRNEHATAPASNVWLGGAIMNGLQITSAKDTMGTDLTIANGIIQLGDLPAGSEKHLDIYGTYTNCELDSMQIKMGWNCTGYPSQLSTYPCKTASSWLYVKPDNTQLQSRIKGPSRDIKLCNAEPYEIQVSNVDFVKAYDLGLDIVLPYGSMIDSGSSELIYPVNAGAIGISEPKPVSGNRYRWDLSTLSQFQNGFSGISDTSRNSFIIRFKLTTDCNFSSGSFFYTQPVGKIKCGKQVIAPISIGDPMNIEGVKRPYFADLKVDLDTLQTCSDGGYTTVRFLNLGPDTTGSSDAYQIVLPQGILIDTGWFAAMNNAPHRKPEITNINGNTLVSYRIPSGIAPGDSSYFAFKIEPDPGQSSCGAVQFFSQTIVKQPALCVSSNTYCDINVATGTDLNLNSISKAEFSFSGIRASSTPLSGGESIELSYRITNSGAENDSTRQFYVKVFDDLNQNHSLDQNETIVGIDTLDFLLKQGVGYQRKMQFEAPDSAICRLKLIIDSLNCVCQPFVALIPNISLENAGVDTGMCSGDSVQIGLTGSKAYSYQWSPSEGIAQPNKAKSFMTIKYTEKGIKDFPYVLTTQRKGCSSTDTVIISVKPGIELNLPAYEKVCRGGSVIIGSPPQGGSGSFRYQWSPIDSLKYPNLSKSQAWPDTTTLYTISVTDFLGCTSTASTLVEVVQPPEAYFFSGSGCVNDPLLIRDSIVQYADIDSIHWSFGDGKSLENIINISHAYTQEGSYDIRLFVRDTNQCSDSYTKTVNINPLPDVQIADSSLCAGDTILIMPQAVVSRGSILSNFEWTADTSVSLASDLRLHSAVEDSIVVMVTAYTQEGCQAQDTAMVKFYPLPLVQLKDTSLCLGERLNLKPLIDSSALSIPSISWNDGNGQISTGRMLHLMYQDSGKYQVQVMVSNSKQCTASDSAEVRVYSLPFVDFIQKNLCLNDTLVLNADVQFTDGDQESVQWTHKHSRLLSDSLMIIATDTGQFTIGLTARSDLGCVDSVIKTYEVYPLPEPEIGLNHVCLGETATISEIGSGNGLQSRLWLADGDTLSSVSSSIALVPPSPGQVEVILKHTDLRACSNADTAYLMVYQLPVPLFNLSNPCEDDLITFEDNSLAGEGMINQKRLRSSDGTEWNDPIPDSLRLSPAQNLVFSYAVTNSLGCTDSSTQTIEVFRRPSLYVVSDTFCEERPSYLIAGSDHFKNNNYQFDWQLGPGNITYAQRDSLLLSFDEARQVQVLLKLMYPDGCEYSYDTIIEVHPLPVAAFSITPAKVNIVNPVIQLWDESTGATEWEYDMGDGTIIREADFRYEYGDSGIYRIVQRVNSNWGCMDTTSAQFEVEFFNTRYMPEAFSPNGDGLNDKFAPIGRGIFSYHLRIYNRWGEMVYNSETAEGGWDGTYKGKPAPIGMYTYQVSFLDHKKREIHLHGSLTLIR